MCATKSQLAMALFSREYAILPLFGILKICVNFVGQW